MTVTTPASPSEVQARLKAAVGCLNLSLEAELTQYRCHRLVQSLSPFPAATVPTAKATEVTPPTEPTLPQLPAGPQVAELPKTSTVSEPIIESAIPTELPPPPSVITQKQTITPPHPLEVEPAKESAPESVMDLLEELEAPSYPTPQVPTPQVTEPITTPLQAWFAPIFPKGTTAPVTPDSITVEESPDEDDELPPGPFPELEDLFTEAPTQPKPVVVQAPEVATPLPTPPQPPTFEPDADEVWFDLGDFQPFAADTSIPTAPPNFVANDSEPTSTLPLSTPTVKQPDSPNTYFDSAAALLENIPHLDSPNPASSPSFLSRGLTMGVVLLGLMTAAGTGGYLWWQMQQKPTPAMDQLDSLNSTPGLENNNIPPAPVASPISSDLTSAIPAPASANPLLTPSQPPVNPPISSSSVTAASSPSTPEAPVVTAIPTPAEAVASPAIEPLAAPMGEPSFFYVIAPYQTPQDLVKARQGINNAYLVQFPEGVKIQFAAFEDAISAQTLVNSLTQQGIKSEVRTPKP